MFEYECLRFTVIGCFSANHINSHAYDTLLYLSIRLFVPNGCIVAKLYILLENCLKKQIGLPNCSPVVPSRTPLTTPHFPHRGTDCSQILN